MSRSENALLRPDLTNFSLACCWDLQFQSDMFLKGHPQDLCSKRSVNTEAERHEARRLGREMTTHLFSVPVRDAKEMTLIMERKFIAYNKGPMYRIEEDDHWNGPSRPPGGSPEVFQSGLGLSSHLTI